MHRCSKKTFPSRFWLLAAAVLAAVGLGGCLTDLATTAQTAMGSVDGRFAVRQGTASYTVDIEVPPGTAGMAPSLSIAYSSSGGDGILGVGFALRGVPAITRCGAAIVSDGFKGGVGYDGDDRFCLSGERLIQVGTNGGDPEYRTQKESWRRILASGTCGSGPCSFTVEEKDGKTSTFGVTGGSAVLAEGDRFTGELAGSIRAWLMDTTVDLNGNVIAVSYTQSPTKAGGGTLDESGSGQTYIDSITYSYQGGAADSRKVRFLYNTRPDPIVQYLGGGLVRTGLRLTEIATSITPAECGGSADCPAQAVMRYSFAYGRAPTTGRSHLSSITQCAASGACFPSTTFGWSAGGKGFEPVTAGTGIESSEGWVGDFNGDGLTDVLAGPREAKLYFATGSGFDSGQSPGFELDDFEYLSFGDFDGNGTTDVYAADVSSGNLYLGGDGPFACAGGCARISIEQEDYRLVGDFNGDGLTDVAIGSDGTNQGAIYLSDGTTLTRAGTYSGVALGQGDDFVADFNGDGRADVLTVSSSSGTIYYASGASASAASLTAGVTLGSGTVLSGDQRWVGDFNGDGLADFMVGSAGTGTINYGTGDGLEAGAQITGLDLADGSTWIGDFNGDGLADLYSASNTSGKLYLGNGTGFACVAGSDGSGCASVSQKLSIESSFAGDFNGDGLTDVFYADGGNSAFNWAASGGSVPASNQAADMLTSITDGYGGATRIDYRPLTDASVYAASTAGGGAAGARGLANVYNPAPLFPSRVSGYPVEQVRGGQYVVASYTQSNDARLNAAQGYSYTYSYFYEDALVNLAGRGWMGYSSITETDPQLKAQTTTYYRQQFPYDAKPVTRAVCSTQSASTCAPGAAEQVRQVDLTWICTDSQSQQPCTVDNRSYSVGATQTFFVSPQQVKRHNLDLGSEVETELAFDDWGNLQAVSSPGDANTASQPLYTCRSYLPPDEDDWHFGFLQYEKQTSNSSCSTNLSTWQSGDLSLEQYAYDDHWNQTTQLRWDDVNSVWFGTYQTFNAQGLAATTADMSGDPAAMVAGTTATTTYDSGFQSFAASYTTPAPEAGGDTRPLTTRYAYDARFGVAVAQQDPNGNIVNTCVDGFGRTVATQGPIQEGAPASVNCLDPAAYGYVDSAFTGNADLVTIATTAYTLDAEAAAMGVESRALDGWTGDDWTVSSTSKDAMGRTAARISATDQGQTVVTLTAYLDPSRVEQQSLPAPKGSTPLWRSYGYDATGRPSSMSVPYTDAAGTTSQVSTTVAYSSGNTVTVTEAEGTPVAETVTAVLRYSGTQPRIHALSRGGGTTTFEYDGLGRVTRTTAPVPVGGSAAVHGLRYDGFGRVVQRSCTSNGTRTYHFDVDGDLETETDANGQTVTYAWDALHRVTSATMKTTTGDVESVVRIAYDLAAGSGYDNVAGQRSTAGVYNAGGQLVNGYTYGYDAYGHTTRQDFTFAGTTVALSTSYDPRGRTSTRTFPAISGSRPQLAAGYWAQNGELESIRYAADGSSFTTWATYSGYDPFGRPTSVVFGNQASETWGFSPEGRVSSQVVTDAGGGDLVSSAVGWNQLGLVDSLLDCEYTGNAGAAGCAGRGGFASTDASQTFAYTHRRLTSASGPYGALTFCYDPSGNLTLSNGVSLAYDGAQVTDGYTATAPADCSTAAGARVFSATYDDNGNMSSRSVTTGGATTAKGFTWSVGDRLLEVRSAGATAERYVYDFAGRRVLKAVYDSGGATVREAVLYPAPDFEVTLPAGGPPQYTVYLSDNRGRFAASTGELPAGSPLAATAAELGIELAAAGDPVASQQLIFHRNLVTSTEVVTDATGASYASVGYTPFGRTTVTPPANDTFRPKLGGKELDATGLYDFAARYYDPSVGRFASADSRLAAQILVQDAFNGYAFALNDPVLHADPSGHGPFLDIVIAGAFEEIDQIVLTDSAANIVVTITDVSDELSVDDLLASQQDEEFAADILNSFNNGPPSDPMDVDEVSANANNQNDARFERAGWRKRRVIELRIEAGGSANAAFQCPTCDTVMTGAKIQRGKRFYVDYDIDHTMMTHAERVKLIQYIEQSPRFQGQTFTRKQFIDIYHEDLRLQCSACNRSHQFEPTDFDETVYTWVLAHEHTDYF
jgi:RHS repeat-associated protein